MKVGNVCFQVGKAIRSQELLHREMSELYNSAPLRVVIDAIDDDDQARARRQDTLLLVVPLPIFVERRYPIIGPFKVERKNLRKLLDTKRPSRHSETL